MSAKVLIVAEHDGKTRNVATAKVVTCAHAIPGAEVVVAVFAADATAVAREAAELAGVNRVVTVDNAANESPLAAVLAPQIAALAKDYTHIFGPSTTLGKDVMPRVAALLDSPQISDIMAVETAHRFRRLAYAGNVVVTVETDPSSKVIGTVRMASFQRTRQRREFQNRLFLGGQARRRSGCLTGRRRRWLRAKRAPGRPDRKNHRPRTLFRRRNFRSHSTPHRNQRRPHHSRD
jgi:electron transfer flavoprotein alpha subunit